MDTRGGQLQVAGVVVGSWGANTQSHRAPPSRPSNRGRPNGGLSSAPPHIMSVGPRSVSNMD